jgi:hypothetical protein
MCHRADLDENAKRKREGTFHPLARASGFGHSQPRAIYHIVTRGEGRRAVFQEDGPDDPLPTAWLTKCSDLRGR